MGRRREGRASKASSPDVNTRTKATALDALFDLGELQPTNCSIARQDDEACGPGQNVPELQGTRACVRERACTQTHKHTHIHTYKHTNTQIHTYAPRMCTSHLHHACATHAYTHATRHTTYELETTPMHIHVWLQLRFLALSATVANAPDIAEWCGHGLNPARVATASMLNASCAGSMLNAWNSVRINHSNCVRSLGHLHPLSVGSRMMGVHRPRAPSSASAVLRVR